jgi:hypothetical protein
MARSCSVALSELSTISLAHRFEDNTQKLIIKKRQKFLKDTVSSD